MISPAVQGLTRIHNLAQRFENNDLCSVSYSFCKLNSGLSRRTGPSRQWQTPSQGALAILTPDLDTCLHPCGIPCSRIGKCFHDRRALCSPKFKSPNTVVPSAFSCHVFSDLLRIINKSFRAEKIFKPRTSLARVLTCPSSAQEQSAEEVADLRCLCAFEARLALVSSSSRCSISIGIKDPVLHSVDVFIQNHLCSLERPGEHP